MLDTQLFCKALKFAAHAASKKDLRYYLVGVRLEWAGETLDVIGTDGSRLAHLRLRTSVPSAAPVAATIPHDDVKRILATLGKARGEVSLQIEVPKDPAQPAKIRVEHGGVSLDMRSVKGLYPEWRRVIPSADRAPGVMPCVDGAFLAEACAAVKSFTLPIKSQHFVSILAGQAPLDAVVIQPAPGTLADSHLVLACQVVVMPMRAAK